MLHEQLSSPIGHRNIPINPPLSCLTGPHTSHPCHLEPGPEHMGVATVPGDGETQLSKENKYKGPGRRAHTKPHLLDQETNAFGFPQRDVESLPSNTTAFILFQMEGALPFW